MLMDLVVHEQGDDIGDKMLNVLEDVIGPTYELPTEDENPNTFKANSSQR